LHKIFPVDFKSSQKGVGEGQPAFFTFKDSPEVCRELSAGSKIKPLPSLGNFGGAQAEKP
jgi:hypothetical protein